MTPLTSVPHLTSSSATLLTAVLLPSFLTVALNPSFTRLLPSLPFPLVLSGWLDSSHALLLSPVAPPMSSYSLSPSSTPKVTVRSAFTPPKYANIAKNAKDLFKKKFDFYHQFKAIHRSPASGVTFESGLQAGAFPLRGYVRSTVLSTYGFTVEAEANTDAAADTKATIKSTKDLYPGLSVSATALSNKGGVSYTGEAEYVLSPVTVTAEVKSNLTQHSAKVSAERWV